MDWAIWAALILGGLAVAGAAAFVAVRTLEAWRTFKRLRRHAGRELDRLADLRGRTAEAAATAADTAALEAALGRLRLALARLAVLRAAVDELVSPLRSIRAVYLRR